jgi:hypothetical protein
VIPPLSNMLRRTGKGPWPHLGRIEGPSVRKSGCQRYSQRMIAKSGVTDTHSPAVTRTVAGRAINGHEQSRERIADGRAPSWVLS